MRHRKKFNHLGRTASHRSAMLSNMACSLIKHKRITTTLAKAKALRVYVEPLITKSKDDSTHSRRTVFSCLKDKEVVAELFRDIAPKIANRPGGYTRILKTGFRLGDAAEMCIVELVDYNENMLKDKVAKKKSTRRSGAKKSDDTIAIAPDSTEEVIVTEVPAEEVVVEDTVEEVAEPEVETTVEVVEEPVADVSVEAAKEEVAETPTEEVAEPEVEIDEEVTEEPVAETPTEEAKEESTEEKVAE